jgi:hypothetical protein
MKNICKAIIILGIIMVACNRQPATVVNQKVNVSYDSLILISMADTIVCDMVIKNPDKDDKWTESCLQYLQRKKLIDTLFYQVYNNELQALDYYTNKPLCSSEVKKMEKEISNDRNLIGKIQFREAWMYDAKNKVFIKKVYSMILGYETYDDKGFVKGYKPLFKVVLP